MGNSSLVNYTRISPNSSNPRNAKIDTIAIHHMAGNASVETCGDIFASTARKASSNYGIGSDGRVGMYVEEKNRSWCTSSAAVDNRAVTIEVANDSGDPIWHVSDKALAKLIDLCTDICKRNGIPKLNYTGDKTGNLVKHQWYAPTGCPGPYLGSKFQYIADEVNKRLAAPTQPAPAEDDDELYRIQVGAFRNKAGAEQFLSRVKAAGFDAFIVQDKPAASTAAAAKPAGIKVGSIVRVKQGATDYNGGGLAQFVYNRNHVVHSINGDRAVISFGSTIVAAVRLSDLTLA